MITEKVILAVIAMVGTIVLGLLAMLTWIAVTHDGQNEALIVTAMVGFLGVVGAIGSTLAANWMGGQHVLKGINQAVPQMMQAQNQAVGISAQPATTETGSTAP